MFVGAGIKYTLYRIVDSHKDAINHNGFSCMNRKVIGEYTKVATCVIVVTRGSVASTEQAIQKVYNDFTN